jgi:imidazole glycerol-phosphate synthase subunit HisH
MDRLALIDYHAGNLTSVRKGFAAVGARLYTPAMPDDLDGCAGIVVPGVGHFGATAVLDADWRAAIGSAIDRGIPVLGICLGLQWLFEGSEEAPGMPGLSALGGQCFRLPPVVKVPHVGWNSLEITQPSGLLEGVPDGTQVYFTHSYAAPITADTVAAATHGTRFAAAVQRERVCGLQFHPEKSGNAGLTILSNFVELTRGYRQGRERAPASEPGERSGATGPPRASQ